MVEQLKLGATLQRLGLVTPAKLISALDLQKMHGGKLGHILVELGVISEDDLVLALQEHFKIPAIDFSKAPQDTRALRLIPREIAAEHLVLPVTVIRNSFNQDVLVVAMEDPTNTILVGRLQQLTQFPIQPMLAGKSRLVQAITEFYRNIGAR